MGGVMLRFHRTYGLTDDYFHLRVTLADAMRSMDVPCDPGSLTHTFPFRVTCSRTVYLYVPVPVSHVSLTLPIWIVDSSMLTISSYAYSFCLVDSSVESLFLDYDSFMLVYLLRLFVLVSRSLVYIWLEMGIRPSSSIYFATTLKV